MNRITLRSCMAFCLTATTVGCGLQDYEAKVEAAKENLVHQAKFAGLRPQLTRFDGDNGMHVTLKLPQFGNSADDNGKPLVLLRPGSIRPEDELNAESNRRPIQEDRVLPPPPLPAIPGYVGTIEQFVMLGPKGLPIYLYVGIESTAAKSAASVGPTTTPAPLSGPPAVPSGTAAPIGTAAPSATASGTSTATVAAPTPSAPAAVAAPAAIVPDFKPQDIDLEKAPDKAKWQIFTSKGTQRIYPKGNDRYGEYPSTFILMYRDDIDKGVRTYLGWRTADEAIRASEFERLVRASAATLVVSPPTNAATASK